MQEDDIAARQHVTKFENALKCNLRTHDFQSFSGGNYPDDKQNEIYYNHTNKCNV